MWSEWTEFHIFMWRYLVLLMVAAHSLIQRLQDHSSSRRQKLVPPTNRYLPITHCKFRLAAPNSVWTFFAVLWFRPPQTKKDYSSSSRSSKLNQVFTFPLTNGHESHLINNSTPAIRGSCSFWKFFVSRWSHLSSADTCITHFTLQGNPAQKSLAWGETLETAVDFGHRIRELPLARCHTLDSAEGPTAPTGQAPPGDPLPTTDATPTLPSQTLLHTCLLSADQSDEPSKNCLRPLGGQDSHLEINRDSKPLLPAAQIHGGQSWGHI